MTHGIGVDLLDDNYRAGQRANVKIDVNRLSINTYPDLNLVSHGNGGTFIQNREGDITIHANELLVKGDIFNHSGTLFINADRDKKVQIEGSVIFARRGIRPEIPQIVLRLGTPDSFLAGAIQDIRNFNTNKPLMQKTTLWLTHGATWYGLPVLIGDRVSVRTGNLHTLKLDGGRVVIATEDPRFDPNGLNRRQDGKPHFKTLTLWNLNNEEAMHDKGGTFVFRVNLVDALTRDALTGARHVQGHGDQLVIKPWVTDYDVISFGHHKVMISDESKATLRERWSALNEEAYALLIKDESRNHDATFTIDPDVNLGKLYPLKAKMTDEAPPQEYGYTDALVSGLARRYWYLTLEAKPSAPSENARVHQDFNEARRALFFLDNDTLQTRLGTPSWLEGEKRLWAHAESGEYDHRDANDYGTYQRLQVGFEKRLTASAEGTSSAGLGLEHTAMSLKAHDYVSGNTLKASALLINYTKLGPKGYWDVVGKVGLVEGRLHLTSTYSDRARWRAPMGSLSVEVGRTFALTKRLMVEPQAQLTYRVLGGAHYESDGGIDVTLHHVDALTARLGAKIAIALPQGDLYANVFLHREFLGRTRARLFDGLFTIEDSHRFRATWATVGLGGQYALTPALTLYGTLSRSLSSTQRNPWDANIGIRYQF